MSSEIIIRVAESAEDRAAVYRFRYAVYVEEMRRPQTYADHNERIVEEPLDDYGHILAAFDGDGQVVGTVRANFSRETPDMGPYPDLYGMAGMCEDFHPIRTSITTKFMVAPRHRRSSLSVRLATSIYEIGLAHGILFDFIDCNPHLENYFRSLGYIAHKERIDHPEYGDVQPMVLALADIDYLNSVRSPFVKSYNVKNQRKNVEVLSDKAVAPLLMPYHPQTHSVERLFAHV